MSSRRIKIRRSIARLHTLRKQGDYIAIGEILWEGFMALDNKSKERRALGIFYHSLSKQEKKDIEQV